jgi:hypothetical protein
MGAMFPCKAGKEDIGAERLRWVSRTLGEPLEAEADMSDVATVGRVNGPAVFDGPVPRPCG